MKLNHLVLKTAVNIPYTNLTEFQETVIFEKYFATHEEAIEYAKEFKKVNKDFQVLNASYNMNIYI